MPIPTPSTKQTTTAVDTTAIVFELQRIASALERNNQIQQNIQSTLIQMLHKPRY